MRLRSQCAGASRPIPWQEEWQPICLVPCLQGAKTCRLQHAAHHLTCMLTRAFAGPSWTPGTHMRRDLAGITMTARALGQCGHAGGFKTHTPGGQMALSCSVMCAQCSESALEPAQQACSLSV